VKKEKCGYQKKLFLVAGTLCSGQLIFDENFNKLDLNLWRHETTLSGGGVSIN
jgi:hypothetical protein